jgi:hypothetical protein
LTADEGAALFSQGSAPSKSRAWNLRGRHQQRALLSLDFAIARTGIIFFTSELDEQTYGFLANSALFRSVERSCHTFLSMNDMAVLDSGATGDQNDIGSWPGSL